MENPSGSANLETDELMRELRRRISNRESGDLESRMDAVESELKHAQEILDSGQLVIPDLLLGDQEWELRTYLRITSHRPIVGKLLILVKRVLLPPLRWLYEYSHVNFIRQKRLNRALLASVEALALELASLRRSVEQLERQTDRDTSAKPGTDIADRS